MTEPEGLTAEELRLLAFAGGVCTKVERLYYAALARAEAAEQDAERMKDEYFGGRTYDYESSERRALAAESRLAEAKALLELARDAIDEACYPVWWERWRAFISATPAPAATRPEDEPHFPCSVAVGEQAAALSECKVLLRECWRLPITTDRARAIFEWFKAQGEDLNDSAPAATAGKYWVATEQQAAQMLREFFCWQRPDEKSDDDHDRAQAAWAVLDAAPAATVEPNPFQGARASDWLKELAEDDREPALVERIEATVNRWTRFGIAGDCAREILALIRAAKEGA